jgi:hypothetical protein
VEAGAGSLYLDAIDIDSLSHFSMGEGRERVLVSFLSIVQLL